MHHLGQGVIGADKLVIYCKNLSLYKSSIAYDVRMHTHTHTMYVTRINRKKVQILKQVRRVCGKVWKKRGRNDDVVIIV